MNPFSRKRNTVWRFNVGIMYNKGLVEKIQISPDDNGGRGK